MLQLLTAFQSKLLAIKVFWGFFVVVLYDFPLLEKDFLQSVNKQTQLQMGTF